MQSEVFSPQYYFPTIGRTSNTIGFRSLPSSPSKRRHSSNRISVRCCSPVSSLAPKSSSTRCSAGRDSGLSPDDSGVEFNLIEQIKVAVTALQLFPWVWGCVNSQLYSFMNQITQGAVSLRSRLLPWLWCFFNPQFNTYMKQVVEACSNPGTINLAHLSPVYLAVGAAFILWILFVYKWGAKTSGAKGLDNDPILRGDGVGTGNYIANGHAPNDAHPINGGREGGALTTQQIYISISINPPRG